MKKLLICDDEGIIRQGIRKILEKTYTDLLIEECENGRDGYQNLVSFCPDVAITDIKMPFMNGLEMIQKAHNSDLKTQFIIISAYSEFEYARTAIKYGVHDYILKPINRFELIQRLNALWHIPDAPIESSQPKITQDTVSKALSFIETNFYKNISLEDVSRAVNMNTNYFSTLFKKQTGKKYIDYLTELRMDKGRKLIQNTDLSIIDISRMIGYNSTKHFTHIYKEYFGVTPSSER